MSSNEQNNKIEKNEKPQSRRQEMREDSQEINLNEKIRPNRTKEK